MLPVVGLMPTFQEGELGIQAARSLAPACEVIFIAEGPINYAPGEPGKWPSLKKTHVEYGAWGTDATKRTALVDRAKAWASGRPFWILWLDGDEILLWGEHLRLWIARAEAEPWEGGDLKVTGGFPLRLVELDGTTVQSMGRILRGDLVDHYLHSAVEVKLIGRESSMALPNVPNWSPGYTDETGRAFPAEDETAYCRRPLQGEPHILHLSALRDPARQAERQSAAEVRGYKERAAAAGITVPEWAAE